MLYTISLKELTPENFAPYGQILAIPPEDVPAACPSDRFDFHPKVATFDLHTGTQLQLGISTFFKRPFRLENMERHYTSEEIMVALNKQGVIIAFARQDGNDRSEVPQADRVEAFLIPPTVGIVVYRDVWHWTPMPLEDRTSIICSFETGTEQRDVHVVPFAGGDVVAIQF